MRQELYEKYLKLATYLEELYFGNKIKIKKAQFEFAKDKLLMIAYSLGLSSLKITNKILKEQEEKYERFCKEIEEMRI